MSGGRFWVAKHVGDYGRPGGDIPGRGTYRIFPEDEEPEPPYAAVGLFASRDEAKAWIEATVGTKEVKP